MLLRVKERGLDMRLRYSTRQVRNMAKIVGLGWERNASAPTPLPIAFQQVAFQQGKATSDWAGWLEPLLPHLQVIWATPTVIPITIITTNKVWPGCYVYVSSGPMSTYSLKTRSGAK